MALTVGAMMSGEELHTLRSRFTRGKATKRLQGKNVNGDQSLPKGVSYVREYAPNTRRTISGTWVLDPLEGQRMRRAFELLFAGDHYDTIAEKIGGGWTGSGLHRAMMNPIWIGIRRYEWEATGEEYLPRPTAKHPKPKKRRRLVKRAVPLDVPTREEIETGKAQPIITPILTFEEWDRAQEIIAGRMTHWRKGKLKSEGRPRPLAGGLGQCSCGQSLYCRYGSKGRSYLDAYYCKSRFPKGCGCGMQPVKRVDLDAAIEQLITKLADAAFLMTVLEAALDLQNATADPARVQREHNLAALADGRKELLALVRTGKITRDEFNAEIALLEKEVRALEALLPAPAPKADPKGLIDLMVRTFGEFEYLEFVQKRKVLQGALKSIIVDGHARAITTVTISGGYLGIGANSVLPSRARCTRRSRETAGSRCIFAWLGLFSTG
jgi:hypothetical protein